jgi:two-component system cell cycle response regulator
VTMSSSGSGPGRPKNVPPTLIASENPNLSNEVMRKIKEPHRPVLVVLTGNEIGRRVVVDRSLLIGRDPAADLALSDALISWHHALVEDRGDGFALSDLGSTNGTTVNGESKPEFILNPNDRIVFGATAVSFELQDALKEGYNENVDRLMNIDDLSGLFVRRKFDTDFRALVESSRAAGTPLTLLVMDLDGIKKINDTHGHLFGAFVIGQSGRLIGDIVGQKGIACRFGGDEYLAALPEHDLEAGCSVAESILRAINSVPFVKDEVVLKPGISIGIASFPDHASDAETLFQKADEALYRAKGAGKNRIAR